MKPENSSSGILAATAPQRQLKLLDSMLDDGNLGTGRFRLTPNNRYTYVING